MDLVSENGVRRRWGGAALLYLFTAQRCVSPWCVWPRALSAVSPQCLTFTMIYDSSLPKITQRKLCASVPVWPNSAAPECLKEVMQLSNTHPAPQQGWKKHIGSNYFVSGNKKDDILLCWLFFFSRTFFLTLDCLKTAYPSLFLAWVWAWPASLQCELEREVYRQRQIKL